MSDTQVLLQQATQLWEGLQDAGNQCCDGLKTAKDAFGRVYKENPRLKDYGFKAAKVALPLLAFVANPTMTLIGVAIGFLMATNQHGKQKQADETLVVGSIAFLLSTIAGSVLIGSSVGQRLQKSFAA